MHSRLAKTLNRIPIPALTEGLLQRGNIDRLRNPGNFHIESPTPVRMFVDRSRNVRLIRDTEKILQRNRQQPGFGFGEKRQNRVEIVALDSLMTQHVGQHIP